MLELAVEDAVPGKAGLLREDAGAVDVNATTLCLLQRDCAVPGNLLDLVFAV